MLLTLFTYSCASETLNPIVVTNSISPIDIHSSSASIEVFTASDIEERGFADMQELLNSISSISVTSKGGIGQLNSIFTRGTESNHTKIILDGVELNPGTLGLAPIHNISLNAIDRIDCKRVFVSPSWSKYYWRNYQYFNKREFKFNIDVYRFMVD